MAELLTGLGIDGKLLLAQALNFGIVLFILWRFAYKPILRVLDARRARVAQGEKDAEAAATDRAEAERTRTLVLNDARKEATSILAEARKAADATRAKALEDAEVERARVLERATVEAEAERSRAMDQARSEVADLVVLASEKVLRAEVTETQQRKLVEQALEDLRR